MSVKLLEATDIASGSFALILIAMVAATVLLIMGTGWVTRKWKLPVALSGTVTLATALHYVPSYEVWLATGQMTVIYRYVGWFVTVPLQVVAMYFFIRAVRPLSVALFWRLLVAAIILVLARYMGEAGFMYPTLGFLIGIAMWLYILGELFFGRMSEYNGKQASGVVRRGYFWLRLILTIGWAIYPLCYFIASFAGGVEMGKLSIVYNLADFINQIAFGLVILTVAVRESSDSMH
jgi:sensory rhodopsin